MLNRFASEFGDVGVIDLFLGLQDGGHNSNQGKGGEEGAHENQDIAVT
jgi:hypothetical protein